MFLNSQMYPFNLFGINFHSELNKDMQETKFNSGITSSNKRKVVRIFWYLATKLNEN